MQISDTEKLAQLWQRFHGRGEALSRVEQTLLYGLIANAIQAPGAQADLPASPEELMLVAQQVAAQVQAPEAELSMVLNQGRQLIHTSQLAKARTVLEAGLDRLSTAAPGSGAWVRLELATVARHQDRLDDAWKLVEQARAQIKPTAFAGLKHDQLLSACLGEFGRISQRLGNLDQADRWFGQEMVAAQESTRPDAIATAHLHRVQFLVTLNLHSVAADHITSILAPDSGVSFSAASKAELRLMLAREQLEANRNDAELGPRFAEQVFAAVDDPQITHSLVLPALRWLAQYHLQKNNLPGAAKCIQKARAELERLQDLPAQSHLNTESAYLSVLEFQLLETSIEAAEFFDAHPQAQQLKQQLAGDLPALKRAFESILTAWSQAPITDQGVGFSTYRNRAQVLSVWLRVQAASPSIGGVEGAFESLLRIQAMGSQARGQGLAHGTLSEVREQLLSPGEGLLVFRLSHAGATLFTVDHQSIKRFELGPLGPIRDLRNRLAGALRSPPRKDAAGAVLQSERDRVSALARPLSEALIPAQAKAVIDKWSRITIVNGDSAIDWIPFAAFDSQAFGVSQEAKPLAYLTSIPVGLFLAKRNSAAKPSERKTPLLFLGGPLHSDQVNSRWPNLEPIIVSSQQRGELASIFPGDPAQILLGSKASMAALQPGALASAQCLQILGHGIYDWSQPHPALVALSPSPQAPDGLLTRALVETLASPPIVILTACGAAKAPLRPGEDSGHSLAGAWLQAGASVVIISSADLDYGATWALSVELHRAMADGLAPGDALLTARRRVASDPRFNHPYYHSLLRVIGLGQVADLR